MDKKTEKAMPVIILNQIHRLVQKLKESGKEVDSVLVTTSKLVEGTVVHDTVVTITGDLKVSVVDERSPEEVKIEAEKEKARLQAEAEKQILQLDDMIQKVDTPVEGKK